MDDLSLFLLDIVENAINAASSLIEVTINEDDKADTISMIIKDNGKGMDEETVQKAIDPFFTTRTTRKVGLGLSLLKQTCEACDGSFVITSQLNQGTKIQVTFKKSHIDTPPLGNMADTITSILSYSGINGFTYKHIYNGSEFVFDLDEVRQILDGVSIQEVSVLTFIKEYTENNIFHIRGGVK